jgi:hypothetical protein
MPIYKFFLLTNPSQFVAPIGRLAANFFYRQSIFHPFTMFDVRLATLSFIVHMVSFLSAQPTSFLEDRMRCSVRV